jgi:hydrogenase maturation protease
VNETFYTPDSGSPRVVIIGVGNSFRSDDGVGVYVGTTLRQLDLPDVDIANEERDGLKIISHWKRGDWVFLIDAVLSGAEAGTIYRIDLSIPEFQLPSNHNSTHSLGIMEAVFLSRILNESPGRIILYGIEGENFEMGTSLSPKVIEAAERVIKLVVQEVNNPIAASHGILEKDVQ